MSQVYYSATCTRQTFLPKTFANSLNRQKQRRKRCLGRPWWHVLVVDKSIDHHNTHFHLFFTTIWTSKNCFFQSASWKRHCATPWRKQRGWTLIENDKLVNHIARLATIVVKFNASLFRYFYNHLSNYTKTIVRLRLVNIGEYLLRWMPIFSVRSRLSLAVNDVRYLIALF